LVLSVFGIPPPPTYCVEILLLNVGIPELYAEGEGIDEKLTITCI